MLSKSNRLFSLAAILVFTTACSGGRNPDREAEERLPAHQNVGGLKAEVKEGAPLFAEGVISGTGAILFGAPLEGVGASHSFEVTFTLEDQGLIEIVTYSSRDLNRGLTFRFTRLDEGPGSLKVELVSSSQTVDISDAELEEEFRIQTLDASKPLTLTFDVHNGERPAHILMWRGSRSQVTAGQALALYNSEATGHDHDHNHNHNHDHNHSHGPDAELTSPGNGSDRFWGLRLNRGSVSAVSSGQPVAGH